MLKNFWYAVAFTHEITSEPTRLEVLGQQLVLFRQRRSGKVVAMSDLCVHRGGALSGGWVDDNDCIVCPYHGWEYAADGTAVRIPANQPGRSIPKKARVDSYPTQERYHFVWVFLGDLPEAQRPPLPEWPEFDAPEGTYRAVFGEYLWKANYERVLENGCDIAHAPWVHGGSFGNREQPEVEEYEIEQPNEWSATATVTLSPPRANIKGIWKWVYKDKPPARATTGWYMPNLIKLHVRLPIGEMIIFDTNIPIDATTTLTKWVALRTFFKGAWADGDARRRTHKIFVQDAKVVEDLRPELLPFDLSAELHMKSDALTVAYRRLRQRLITEGWGIDAHRIRGEVPGTEATVIPSPARREVPELARAWVMREVPVRDETLRSMTAVTTEPEDPS